MSEIIFFFSKLLFVVANLCNLRLLAVLSVLISVLFLLTSEKSQAVYYISSCHMLIDKALSSDKPNGHWFEADWLHCKRDALSSNRKVDGSRLTGSTQVCHS